MITTLTTLIELRKEFETATGDHRKTLEDLITAIPEVQLGLDVQESHRRSRPRE